MFGALPSIVFGFHGCDQAVAEQVFAGKSTLKASDNDYDWLGHGVYFWENNPQRALDYARLLKKHPERSKVRIKTPAVVGAVIDLGFCFNLLDAQFIRVAKSGYHDLNEYYSDAGIPLPTNKRIGRTGDLLLRPLDCAVIETVHLVRQKRRKKGFDTTRGVFVEGGEIYPGAGINEFNHIQICVRNMRCIKGFFRPLK